MVEKKTDLPEVTGKNSGVRGLELMLWLDGVVNLILGALLIPFPHRVVEFLGVPPTEVAFYPSLLGAVFIGIGLALIQQGRRGPGEAVGLGLGGAIAINLCGGGALAAWLLSGRLDLPLRGALFLWGLVAFLVGISILEWQMARRPRTHATTGEL